MFSSAYQSNLVSDSFCLNFLFLAHELKVLDLYVWLSYRLEDSFPDRELASSQRAICSLWVKIIHDKICDVYLA